MIQVLEGLDPVRKRPGMYIGSTGQRGLHHLVCEHVTLDCHRADAQYSQRMLQVTEILDNAIDEVQAGHASNVQVKQHKLRCVSIQRPSDRDADLDLTDLCPTGSTRPTNRLGDNFR